MNSFSRGNPIFLLSSKDKKETVCPDCHCSLRCHDHRERYVTMKCGKRLQLLVPRGLCPECGRLHTVLPDFVVPYKHYGTAVIQGVVDGKDLDTCMAEESTMQRWRRECPSRSIIHILELEGKIQPGTVNRSTLQRHLQKRGFGTKQVNMYRRQSPAARRFQKTYRGQLYQGDIKYGPYLPIGPNGKMVQTYMAAWIDDATRFVVHAEFYANQKVDIIEDSLRQALMNCGQPQAIYVDNGKQYRSDWLRKACAKLGIKLIRARSSAGSATHCPKTNTSSCTCPTRSSHRAGSTTASCCSLAPRQNSSAATRNSVCTSSLSTSTKPNTRRSSPSSTKHISCGATRSRKSASCSTAAWTP